MADFASIIGGSGTQVPVDQANPNLAFAYFWTTGDKSINIGGEDDTWDSSTSTGTVTVYGGSGSDGLFSGAGNDVLSGQDGNDSIDAGDGSNTVGGGSGNDNITGGAGNDVLSGDSGNDTINAGGGADKVYGGDGNDQLSTGDGNDQVYAGSGNDTVAGGAGNDLILGMSGDDLIAGDAGNDTLYSGDGNDIFWFDSGFGTDVIKDFSPGADQIVLTAAVAPDLAAVQSAITPGTVGFTLITFGSDSIRVDGIDASTFIANLGTYVKIQ